MIENVLPSMLLSSSRPAPRSTCSPFRRLDALMLVLTLGAGPTLVQASPGEHKSAGVAGEGEALALDQQRHALADEALALVQQKRFPEASAAWERLAEHESDTEARVIAQIHAADARLMAFEASGEPAHHCAAERILARILEEEIELDERARQDFTEMLEESRSLGIECSTDKSPSEPRRRTVPLLMDTTTRSAPSPSPRRAAPRAEGEADTPRRSTQTNASTISGAVSLSLAAPLLGGLLYALLDDLSVSAELQAYMARVEHARTLRRHADAFFIPHGSALAGG